MLSLLRKPAHTGSGISEEIRSRRSGRQGKPIQRQEGSRLANGEQFSFGFMLCFIWAATRKLRSQSDGSSHVGVFQWRLPIRAVLTGGKLTSIPTITDADWNYIVFVINLENIF